MRHLANSEAVDRKTKQKHWWETAKTWVCNECDHVNPMGQDYCSECDCSLDGYVDDEWLYECEQCHQPYGSCVCNDEEALKK
jgi:membrane protease subunit (stomatin/prohibitin family)